MEAEVRGRDGIRWGCGGGLVGKAGSVAALIYVLADIKGLCT